MNYNKKTVKDIDVAGKKVLLRCDFNVPQDKATGAITDDKRIVAALPTIQYLLEQNAAVIACSHLGKPKEGPDPKFSLAPGKNFTPLPCSSSPNETRCIAVGGFAALQYGVPLAGAALGSRWVPEPPPDADGVTPGWPRSRSPRSRGPSGWRRRSDRRPRRAGPAAHGRSLRSWSRRTGW
mgnify:CR=1 FL=1